MKDLLHQEEKKIWKRKTTQIAVVCVLFFIALMPIIERNNTRFYISVNEYITGKEAIEKEKEAYKKVEGELDTSKLMESIQVIHTYVAGKTGEMEASASLVLNEQMAPYHTMMRIIGVPIARDKQAYGYVNAFEDLSVQDAHYVYDRWKDYVLSSFPDQAYSLREYLDENVTTFQYGYAHGLAYTGSKYMDLVLTISIVIIIGLSSIFAQEKKSGADVLILSSKKGRKHITTSKILASIRFSTLIYGMSLIVFYGSTAFFLGLEGGDINIQVSWISAPMQWNMLELNLLMMFLGYASVLCITMLILLASQYSKSTFKTQVALIILLYFSYTLQVLVNDGTLSLVIHLLPFGLLIESIYRSFPFCQLFELRIFLPFVYLVIDACIGAMIVYLLQRAGRMEV